MAFAKRLPAWLTLAALLTLGGCVNPQQGGLRVWFVSGDHEVSPEDPPLTDTMIYNPDRRRIELVAAIDETVAVQIGLRGSVGLLGSVKVELDPFQGPGAAQLPPEAVQLFVHGLATVQRFPGWYPAHTGRSTEPREVYDLLIPYEASRGGGPIRPQPDRAHYAWLDVHVPAATPPGSYRSQLRLSNGGQSVGTYDVLLRVAPLALPAAPTLPIVTRCDPTTLLSDALGWPVATPETTRILPGTAGHGRAQQLVGDLMETLHQHRTNPVLWASFPKYRSSAPGVVEIDWEAYDALVEGWLDGSNYGDRVRSTHWALPLSSDYPDAARNGGLTSSRYAQLVAGYARACAEHFAERGWLEQAFVRPVPPGPYTAPYVQANQKLAGALEGTAALLVHTPPQAMRTLGWHNAPDAGIAGVGIWAPPADWLDPAGARQLEAVGQQAWFTPGVPPYSPDISRVAPAADATTLAWLAYRYGLGGIWIEHAVESRNQQGGPEPLVYSGKRFGVPEKVVPTVRLKRLRRSQQDYELLRLLEAGGKTGLARQTSSQVVRWAFAEACNDNLLSTRSSGWSTDARVVQLARELLRQELSVTFAPDDAAGYNRAQLAAEWARLMEGTERVELTTRGARLQNTAEGVQAVVFAQLENSTQRSISGEWALTNLPAGWNSPAGVGTTVASNANTRREIEVKLDALSYNADGVAEFTLALQGGDVALEGPGRAAITSCPIVETSVRIDGDLSDWPINPNNTAGDFQLVRGESPGGLAPHLPTRAYFCMDRENLYIAVFCALESGERPFWRPDNRIEMDGAIPWGQDLVEVLLHPRNTPSGSGEEIYSLQIKPSGLLVERQGTVTEPPMNPSRAWRSDARVAAKESRKAWAVELAIPFSTLGEAAVRNNVWGVNITRLDSRRGEYSSWSGARGYAYLPELLGNLVLLRP